MTDPEALHGAISEQAGKVLVGNDDIIEGLTISLLTRGHVLLEGVPGVAKTTIAKLFSQTLGLEYQRIQMTPDLMPADITGTKIYREQTGEFELARGPLFANLVVADEINRATPKTQSALLEAMQEQQVTIEGETLSLPSPFMIIATQNPIEMEGTFGLPEAQRDRFQLKLVVDLPDREMETELFDRFDSNPDLSPDETEHVVSPDDIRSMPAIVNDVYVDPSVREYILDIVEATRSSPDIKYGASPRATLHFLSTSKARAAIRGREYVIPDDPKSLAEQVLAHRLVLSTDAELSDVSPREIIRDVIADVRPPDGADVSAADGEVSAGETAHDGGSAIDPSTEPVDSANDAFDPSDE